jgi:hypothetical protein
MQTHDFCIFLIVQMNGIEKVVRIGMHSKNFKKSPHTAVRLVGGGASGGVHICWSDELPLSSSDTGDVCYQKQIP